jgi:hypothetical protein
MVELKVNLLAPAVGERVRAVGCAWCAAGAR